MGRVYLFKVEEYNVGEIRASIENALEDLGGFSQFFSRRDRVLLKPNLLSAKSPDRNITTHPSILAAIIDILQEHEVEVFIGDSSGGAHKGVERVYRETGMQKLAADKGIKLVNFEESGAETIKKDGYSFKISRAFLQFDKVINISKFKSHSLTLATGAIKNMFGIVPGLVKTGYHKKYPFPSEFARFIASLYGVVKNRVVLNIMDAVWGMEGNGPSAGESRHIGYLIISSDAIAVDIVQAKLMGYRVNSIPILKEAIKLGIGEGEDKLEVIGEEVKAIPDFKKPINTYFLNFMPRPIVQLLARLIYIRPTVDMQKCTGCGMCYRSCPEHAITMVKGRPVFDYSHCIVCLCCHEVCPESAIVLRKSFFAKLIGR